MGLIIYIFIMLTTLYLMIMYTETLFFLMFIAEFLLLIVCFVMALVLRFKIRVGIVTDNTVVSSKEPVPLVLEVENKSIIPTSAIKIRCRYFNTLGQSHPSKRFVKEQWVQVYVNSKTTAKIKLHLESDYCGILNICLNRCKVSDFLHVFSFGKKLNLVCETTIFPKLTDINFEISPGVRDFVGESDLFSKERSGDDPSEVFDVRPYRMGDRLQQVHWKLTARMDETFVKEFSRPIGYPVVIFWDLSKEHLGDKMLVKALAYAIEKTISISKGLIEAECRHYIAWCDEHLTIHRQSIEHIQDIYDVMHPMMTLKVHESIANPRSFYGQKFGFESFYTMLCVNLGSQLLKDGEVYEDTKQEWDSLSGKNFIL